MAPNFFFHPNRLDHTMLFTVLYSTVLSSKPAAKTIEEPYDRVDGCPPMILISEKHLGAQPQLSGARPTLIIFSPILTSKMVACRSKCGVMKADGQCAVVRLYKRARVDAENVRPTSAKSTFYMNVLVHTHACVFIC